MVRLILATVLLGAGKAAPVIPEEGMYYDPEESGTGLVLEYQAGVVVVTYFGYDDAGLPVWWQFSDDLEEAIVIPGVDPLPPPQSDGMSIHYVEGELNRFEGGQCLGCPFSEPEVVGTGGFVRIFFETTNEAVIFYGTEFNDSNSMLHIEFGYEHFSSGIDPDEDRYPYFAAGFPDLRGEWTFVTEAGVNGPWRYRFTSAEVVPGGEESTYRVRFGTRDDERFMECVPAADLEVMSGCELYDADGIILSARLGDIGVERIYGFRGRLGTEEEGPLRRKHKIWGFRIPDRSIINEK